MTQTDPAQGEEMSCPKCRVSLVMTERMGIEIDYCPRCRGIWLDRGELDKIIERSVESGDRRSAPPRDTYESNHSGDDRHGGHGRGRSGRRRGSWLADLFD